MSRLRPTLRDAEKGTPCPTNGTAYLLIYTAVERESQLVHGKLHDGIGHHCAIGCFFETNPRQALQDQIIDEVAAVNDSVPHFTPQRRRTHVLRWLKWKLQRLGYPFKGRKIVQP